MTRLVTLITFLAAMLWATEEIRVKRPRSNQAERLGLESILISSLEISSTSSPTIIGCDRSSILGDVMHTNKGIPYWVLSLSEAYA